MNLSITSIIGLLLIGLIAGTLSSMVGIGGGLVIVPGLVLVLAVSQKMAQGTSLALMLPPIGILAVVNYYKAGYVDFRAAAIVCVTFLAGSYLGSKFAVNLPENVIKKIFGAYLLVMAIKYLFLDKK
jgi:uncharacterized membrane protein YfcA